MAGALIEIRRTCDVDYVLLYVASRQGQTAQCESDAHVSALTQSGSQGLMSCACSEAPCGRCGPRTAVGSGTGVTPRFVPHTGRVVGTRG